MRAWKATRDNFGFYVEDAESVIICDVREPQPTGGTVEERMERHLRRTQLLAAAPLMHETLRKISVLSFAAQQGFQMPMHLADDIQMALAAVEGKSDARGK